MRFFKLFLHPEENGGLADNTGAASITAPVEPATPTEPAPEPVKESVKPQEPDVTATKAFSDRLNAKLAEKDKEFDQLISKMGVEWNGKPITTRAEYEKALHEQELAAEAAKQNVPVEILQELQTTKSTAQQALDKLSAYERKEQIAKEAETLASDAKWGEFFKANEAAIREVADRHNIPLATAKLIVYDEIGPQKVDEAAIGKKAVETYLDEIRKGNKPIEGAGATPIVVPAKPKSFDEADKNTRTIIRNTV